MATGTLMNHKGAREIDLAELSAIEAPPPTETWFPVSHFDVYASTRRTLIQAGYIVGREKFSVARDNNRFFGVLDLESKVCDGVSLAVGIRNSTDKSFPIGFCAGSRVFVCDNLAFHSEVVISKKHTRFGEERFRSGIANAVTQLGHYKEAQEKWIGDLKAWDLSREKADSLILRAFEEGLISTRLLPAVIQEWREPSYEDFREPNGWSLWNCFTTVIGRMKQARPAEAANMTLKLQGIFTPDLKEIVDGEFTQPAVAV